MVEPCMQTRRMTSVAVALTTAVAVLSGCDRGSAAGLPGAASSQPSTPPAATPREALRDAAALVSRSGFRLTIKGDDSTTTASIDAVAMSASMRTETISSSGSRAVTEMRQLGPRTFIRLQLPGILRDAQPKEWMRIDPARVRRPESISLVQRDPTTADTVLDHIITVTGSNGRYTGTVDLSTPRHRQILASFTIDKNTLASLGERARRLPFSAATDQQGRLAKIGVEVPATDKSSAYRAEIMYDHFGARVPSREPRPAVDATDYIYTIANPG